MKLAIKISYVGTAYCGFQFQPEVTTIQSQLTAAAEAAFGFPVNVTGCSRTDAGVHAEGFVAVLEPKDKDHKADWSPIPAAKLHRVFRFHLPSDISVIGAAEVPDDFHPRYDVVAKEYRYRIWDAPFRNPFLTSRVCEWDWPITEEREARMRDVLPLFCGKHDFSAFMAVGSKITDTVREVYETSLSRDSDGCLVFSVKADGFLYNMVRIMAGTLLEVSSGRKNREDVEKALQTGNRNCCGFTAPPEGLYLHEVFYQEPIRWLAE